MLQQEFETLKYFMNSYFAGIISLLLLIMYLRQENKIRAIDFVLAMVRFQAPERFSSFIKDSVSTWKSKRILNRRRCREEDEGSRS